MAQSKGWKPGRWKAVCDRCGFRFHSDALRKEWTGLMVCGGCWETRNPQDFVKVVPEKIVPPWIRDEAPDTFNNVCYIWDSSCYAGLATAGCALAGNQQYTYAFLFDLSGGQP